LVLQTYPKKHGQHIEKLFWRPQVDLALQHLVDLLLDDNPLAS
jgi:hypothetical protein